MSTTVNVTPQTPTWGDYIYSWSSAPVDDWGTVSVWDYSVEATEAINILDSVKKTILQQLVDSVSITDSLFREFIVNRAFNENVNTSDSINKTVLQQLTDSVNITDSLFREFIVNRSFNESVNTSDSLFREFIINRAFNENINITDLVKKTILHKLAETLNITDSVKKTILQQLVDSIDISDSLFREFTVNRVFNESINITDYIGKAFTKKVSELISLVDTLGKNTIKKVDEALVFTIGEGDPGIYIRNFYETVTIVEHISKTLSKKVEEGISTKDYFIHPVPQVVLEDLTTWNGYDSSFWDKEGKDIKPSNYEDWITLKEGDYEYKNALVRIIVDLQNLPGNVDNVTLNECEIVSDVYDIDISGTGTILSSDTDGSIIYFGRKFNRIPDVLVTSFTSSSSGFSIPVITEITDTYFKCKIVDANNTLYNGDISWKAEGY